MDPKTATALVALLISAGAQSASAGVLDTPALLAWCIAGSVSGGVVSVLFMESEARAVRSTRWQIVGRWVVSFLVGVFGSLLAVRYLTDPPYEADLVAISAFFSSLAAWWLLRDVWPVVKDRTIDALKQWKPSWFRDRGDGGIA